MHVSMTGQDQSLAALRAENDMLKVELAKVQADLHSTAESLEFFYSKFLPLLIPTPPAPAPVKEKDQMLKKETKTAKATPKVPADPSTPSPSEGTPAADNVKKPAELDKVLYTNPVIMQRSSTTTQDPLAAKYGEFYIDIPPVKGNLQKPKIAEKAPPNSSPPGQVIPSGQHPQSSRPHSSN
ncbi:hypothetical protein TNCV_3362211 [Trichonephila clavipes]|nr:hypothetical protein TNCV_3362211 [Trichonephila clavipes]